jgi:hypothetical protein
MEHFGIATIFWSQPLLVNAPAAFRQALPKNMGMLGTVNNRLFR